MDWKICLSIVDSNVERVKEHLGNFDFCELRLDLIKPDLCQLEELMAVNRNVIVTCRENKEIDRIKYLKEAIKLKPKYIDIEFETDCKVKEQLIELCELNKVGRIHSYHNFSETPAFEYLLKISEKEFSIFQPDLIKIATYVNNEKDNITLVSLLRTSIPLVVLGMGDAGKKTRIFAPFFGSKFTFASIDGKKSAPGQIDYLTMEKLYNLLEEVFL